LAYKFFGQYEILEKVGEVPYNWIPASSAIHPVYHISQLKEFTPDHTPVFSELPVKATLDNTKPEANLDSQLMKKGNAQIA
jgi:hypothetical protein